MTKRKKLPSQPSPAVRAATGEGTQELYDVGEWAGRSQYRCRLCAFDTLIGEVTMLTHLVEAHNSEAALDALFPKRAAQAVAVKLQEPAKTESDVPEGDPARGVFEIDLEEVSDGKNSAN